MIKHFKLAILLATVGIVFAGIGGNGNRQRFQSLYPNIPESLYNSEQSSKSPGYQTDTVLSNEYTTLADLLQKVNGNLNKENAEQFRYPGPGTRQFLFCCDDEKGTINCDEWNNSQICPRYSFTRTQYINTPNESMQRKVERPYSSSPEILLSDLRKLNPLRKSYLQPTMNLGYSPSPSPQQSYGTQYYKPTYIPRNNPLPESSMVGPQQPLYENYTPQSRIPLEKKQRFLFPSSSIPNAPRTPPAANQQQSYYGILANNPSVSPQEYDKQYYNTNSSSVMGPQRPLNEKSPNRDPLENSNRFLFAPSYMPADNPEPQSVMTPNTPRTLPPVSQQQSYGIPANIPGTQSWKTPAYAPRTTLPVNPQQSYGYPVGQAPMKPDYYNSRIAVRPELLNSGDINGKQLKFRNNGAYQPVDLIEFKNDMRDRHNYFRIKHGVDKLQTHEELHVSAQNYANFLASKDPGVNQEHSNTAGIGENLYYIKYRANRMGRLAVDRWWAELEYCTPYDTGETLAVKMDVPGQEIGHMLQLLWTGTNYVGYGIAKGVKTHGYYIVAHYYPQGNEYIVGGGQYGVNKVNTRFLPLPFQSKHIREAQELANKIRAQLINGIASYSKTATSEENAQDFASINT